MGGGFNYLDEHNDDLLLYDYYIEDGDPINKADRLGPPIMIPKGTEINAYFGNDPHGIVTINSNVSLWNNDYEDGTLLSISFGMHTSEYFDFDFEYRQSSSDERFRWLEALYRGPNDIEYIKKHRITNQIFFIILNNMLMYCKFNRKASC